MAQCEASYACVVTDELVSSTCFLHLSSFSFPNSVLHRRFCVVLQTIPFPSHSADCFQCSESDWCCGTQRVWLARLVSVMPGLYITFSIWGGSFISSSRGHSCPSVVHSRVVWGYAPPPLPQGNFGNFKCSEAHSGAFWGIQWSTQSFLRRSHHHNHCLLSYWNTGNHTIGLSGAFPCTQCRRVGITIIQPTDISHERNWQAWWQDDHRSLSAGSFGFCALDKHVC